MPQARAALEPFLARVADGLRQRGLEIVVAPVCRRKDEFEAAVTALEAQGADCIVTLHLAYSPSLEGADALAGTPLPVVICDTTMDADFGPGVAAERIMFNHGIHGVQDLANLLRRRGKVFAIAAGHVEQSDVLSRTAQLVRAASAARAMHRTRALRVGEAFAGMGDFSVPPAELRESLGIRVEQIAAADLAADAAAVSAGDVEAEMALDRQRFDADRPAGGPPP